MSAIRSNALVDALLEAEALAGAGGLCLGDALVGILALQQARNLLLEAGHLGPHPLGRLVVALAEELELGPVAGFALERRLADPELHGDQRIRRVFGGQRADQLGLRLLDEPGDRVADLRLNALITAEGLRQLFGHRLRAGLDRAAELLLELAGHRLDLAPHVVDVGRRLLAIEHTGADLDHLHDGVRRRLAGLGTLADDPRGGLVGDGQALDNEAVAERPDGARRLEIELTREVGRSVFGCFHRTHEGSRKPGWRSDHYSKKSSRPFLSMSQPK